MLYKIIKQIPLLNFIIQELLTQEFQILFVIMIIFNLFVYFCLYIYLIIDEHKSKKENKNGNKKNEYT